LGLDNETKCVKHGTFCMGATLEAKTFSAKIMSLLTPIVKHLLLLNGLFFLAQQSYPLGGYVDQYLSLFPAQSPFFRPWQLLSYGFLHGDLFHLLFNMYGLYIFGTKIEMVWGQKRMLSYFLICVIGAALTQLAFQYIIAQNYPLETFARTVGASGGVMGILLAYAVLFPNDELYLFFFPFPIKAKFFVALYAAAELYNGVFYTQSGIAHFAHLGGMFFGAIPLLWWRRGAFMR
jgi:membrane associated rhomboid family serine protease